MLWFLSSTWSLFLKSLSSSSSSAHNAGVEAMLKELVRKEMESINEKCEKTETNLTKKLENFETNLTTILQKELKEVKDDIDEVKGELKKVNTKLDEVQMDQIVLTTLCLSSCNHNALQHDVNNRRTLLAKGKLLY